MMKRCHTMRWIRPGILLVAALSAGCAPSEDGPEVFLIVKPARRQSSAGSAVNIVVQSRGGRSLLLRTQHATHRLAQHGAERRTSCVATTSQALTFVVHPEGDLAEVLVDLLEPPPQASQEVDPAAVVGSDAAELLTCISPILASRTYLIGSDESTGGAPPSTGVVVTVSGSRPEGAAGEGAE